MSEPAADPSAPCDPAAEPARPRRAIRRVVSALMVDLTPLRTSPDFRILWVAGTVFYLGGMVSYVALPFQLYHLTGSNFAVGALGLVQLIPLIGAGLYGGALADHVDRRTMLLLTGIAQILLTGGLLANAALAEPKVWLVYAIGAGLTVAQGLQRPSREALIPRVVRHDELPAAVTLSSFGMQLSMLAGPALGGVLVAQVGLVWAYGVNVTTLVLAALLYLRLRRHPPSGESQPPSIAGIVDGIRYAIGRRDLLGTYLVDMVAMIMATPIVLYPALASDVLHEPGALGLLYSVGTLGGLAATVTSGWTSRVHRHGRAVVLAAAIWGVAVGVAGLTRQLWVVLLAFAVAGAADMISGIFRSVIWNQTIPDERRGRLAGIEMLGYTLGPLAGEARAGLVADATTVRTSILSGGLLCVAGVAATAAWLRQFWTYDARTDEHAVRERDRRAAAAAAADAEASR